jgi:hypothetical protein
MANGEENNVTDTVRYVVAVPMLVTVVVEAAGLDEAGAKEAACDYAESLAPSETETDGYQSVAFAGRDDGMRVLRADVHLPFDGAQARRDDGTPD